MMEFFAFMYVHSTYFRYCTRSKLRTTDPEFLDLGRQIISTHFGTVSPLSMCSNIQPLFLQKTWPFYPHPKWNWDLNLGRKELGI